MPFLGFTGRTTGLWLNQPYLVSLLKDMPTFQCPTHPDPKQQMDYVASAFPIPYTDKNVRKDQQGPPGSAYRGVTGYPDYVAHFRYNMIVPRGPGRLIMTSEGHVSLPADDIRYHHMFFSNQLPFGGYPRMASDLRHPGGLNNLFFDGQVRRMSLQQIDSAWPNPVADRLRWFTIAPVTPSN